MNKEKRLITMIDSIMPASPLRKNICFESDAEIIRIGDETVLYTIDEFSREDLFLENDPYTLGWNIAVGALSDILAAGGIPIYYSHAVMIKNTWTEDYIKKLMEGIAAVLKQVGITFIGGDFGKSETWRYTASIIGKPIGKPILRKGAAPGNIIYMSGEIGAGNLEAGLNLYSDYKAIGMLIKNLQNRFSLRIKESRIISKFATACIDTSDGVFDALTTISELNNVGFEVSDLPYIKKGVMAAKLISIPKTMFFLGGCGEYELLFTIKPEDEQVFLSAAKGKNLKFYYLGIILPDSDKQILNEDNNSIDLSELKIQARDYDNVKDYLSAITGWIKEKKEKN